MSRFSGKCDLYDSMMMSCDDELKAFEKFKKETGGVIYQMHNIREVDESNQDFIAKYCDGFKVLKHERQDPDKRFKSGYKDLTSYTYEYYGKEYTAKELKKKGGVYVRLPIHFDTILELVKYYPYVISMAAHSEGHSVIVVGDRPFPEREAESLLKRGHYSRSVDYYGKELAKHYRDVVRLLDKDIDWRIRKVPVEDLKKSDGGYSLEVNDPIDPNHELKFVWKDEKPRHHWSDPVALSDKTISISELDVESLLKEEIEKGEVEVEYVSVETNNY